MSSLPDSGEVLRLAVPKLTGPPAGRGSRGPPPEDSVNITIKILSLKLSQHSFYCKRSTIFVCYFSLL